MSHRCTIDAFAKINLGLEITGRRDDGFHNIRSILAMIDLADTLTFETGTGSDGQFAIYPDSKGIDFDDNLIVRAIAAFNRLAGTHLAPSVHLVKRIPVAAGLGGASSDCAATLLAMNHLTRQSLGESQLLRIAAELGSDVPFFLGPPVSSVSGRGIEIESLPELPGSLLIVAPDIWIPEKTRTLYGALTKDDFSSGQAIDAQILRLRTGTPLDPSLLGNAFQDPLERTSAESAALTDSIRSINSTPFWLSGAGPSRYALFDTPDDRDTALVSLRSLIDEDTVLIPVSFAAHGLIVRT